MKNLSVRLKLLLGLAPLLVLVTALAAIAVLSLSALTHRAERLVSVNYILDHLNDLRAAQMAYALTGEPAELQTLGKAQQQIDALIAENLAKMPYPRPRPACLQSAGSCRATSKPCSTHWTAMAGSCRWALASN